MNQNTDSRNKPTNKTRRSNPFLQNERTPQSPLPIEGPYRHGNRFRCRLRGPTGRRWLPSADTPEVALQLAQQAALATVEPQQIHEPQLPQNPSDFSDSLDPADQTPESLPRHVHSGAVRIAGPFAQAGRWRCRLVSSAGRQWAPMAATPKEALRLGERMATSFAKQGSTTISSALAAYLETKCKAGWRPATLTAAHSAVRAYCHGILDWPVSKLTPHRAQQQYDKLHLTTSVATHRAYLSRTKSWARWVVRRGWLRQSPVEHITGVGRRRRGKLQLSWDEGNRLGSVCLAEASEGATAILLCLLMGLRVSEVVSRVVRDVDRGGTQLRINDNLDVEFLTKTEKSKRWVKIPSRVRPLIDKLASGKTPSEPLFPGTVGGRKCRQWLWDESRRLCKKADVPLVCPHSLRGWMATTAVAAGELPEVVAQALGHASAQITLGHYIAPGVAEAAQLERGQAAFSPSLPT